jgi:hypothetical protein
MMRTTSNFSSGVKPPDFPVLDIGLFTRNSIAVTISVMPALSSAPRSVGQLY